jgi:acyl carrier protein
MIQDELRRIFQQSFGIENIDDSMSIENIQGWDSMAHVGLMMELQKVFNVSIGSVDAIELTDIASIKNFLNSKIKQ